VPASPSTATDTPIEQIDTLIVGAGPAGAAAAITLAAAGRSATVIDRSVFPRDKCCGDGLTTLALRELELLGVTPEDVPNWMTVDSAHLRSPSGRSFDIPLPGRGIYAAVAPRADLDNSLVLAAESVGADIRQGWRLDSIGQSADSVHIGVTDADGTSRELNARHVIAADGMWSPTRRLLGLTPDGYRGEWNAFRQYVSNVTGPAAERLIVWFEPDLLPGYAWSFPLPGGRANIGFGVLREHQRRGRDMAGIWRDLLARDHIVAALGEGHALEDRHTAWPIPARVDTIRLSAARVLLTGDAAAATDVMTGEGIGQALLTGRLAAEAILDAADTRVADTYERSVRDHLFADHRMSRRLGRVLGSARGAELALRTVERSGSWGRAKFARWMFEDEPRALMLTPRRWHRRMLRRDGAYADRQVA
jgi:geranylgeranyl reductase family protein